MTELVLGNIAYRLTVVRDHDRWRATAERLNTGERYGPDFQGPSEDEARRLAAAWLCWQHEHSAALEALRQAERAYHRAVAGSAFGPPADLPSGAEAQRDSLDAVDAARRRLDALRGRRPL